MKIFFIILSLIGAIAAGGQRTPVPRDTSFTVLSSYIKERKNFPFIEIAKPPFPALIDSSDKIIYDSIGERTLELQVFYPAKRKNGGYPGVLLIHGGGWRTGDPSQMNAFAWELASLGYVTVSVEYRLSIEAPYPAAMQDVKTAIRWMKAYGKNYKLDTGKVAALGFSSGGQMAALMATTNGMEKLEGKGYRNVSSSIHAAVDIDGILAFKHPESAEGLMASQWLGGTYEQEAKIWEEASALTHVSNATVPILFINSSLPRFHAGRDDMLKKLDSLHIYSEVHTFSETPHTFLFFHPWFHSTVTKTHRFLNKVFYPKQPAGDVY
ncbi:MAG TPA: alpha/beta hydrolase [Chitinophagaceae bacterium]|nr:alpha/beta hydrolase [Chitinophagaceae bacterium]